jgi:protocatechuate 3,4-dioxygenase beta subunit
MACAFCAECDTTKNGSDPVCEAPDADGRYVLQRLPPANYQVSLAACGYLPRIANRDGPVHLRNQDIELPDAELEEGGAQVTGTVSDATGGPVAGATVLASFASDELALGRYVSQITKSDQTGSYRLCVPPGQVGLVARATGYAEARVGTHAPSEGIRLVLTPSSRISGTVVAQRDHSPVAGLRVIAHDTVGGFEQATTSGNDGAFAVVGLHSGTYRVDASGDGWIGQHSGSVTIDISEAAQNIVIPVVTGAQVTGAVRVGEDPCRSGVAYLTPAPGQPLPKLTARANLSGQVAFEAVPPGRYQSSGFCDGYGMRQGPEVNVASANVSGLSWKFEKNTNVTVRSVTTEGKPVAGALVTLTPASDVGSASPGGPRPRSARTNGAGVYQFFSVAEGTYVLGGPQVENPTTIQLRSTSDTAEFAVTLRPVGAIDVVVKDARGGSNDAVMVTYTAKAGGAGVGFGQPLGDGRYHIGPLPAGDYHVEIRDGVDPVLSADGPDGVVRVRAGEVTQVEATYGGHSGRIAGRVIDSAGMPVENVWVNAQPSGTGTSDIAQMMTPLTHATERRSLTNAEGRFAIDGLLETAAFSVVASHALGGQARIDGVAVGRDVELTLSAPGRLTGLVLNGSGQPATYFTIVVANKDGTQSLVSEFGSDAQGSWSVDHVAPGSIKIQAQSPEGSASVVRELGPSQKMEGIELRLQPSASAQN